MGNAEPDTTDAVQTRIGRRPVPVLLFPMVAVASVVYALLASLNPVINQSFVAVFLLALLFLIVSSFIVLNVNGDALDPFRLMSVYYLMCFCISPLFVVDPIWHFSAPLGPLAAKSALFLTVGYLMTAAGYYLPVFRPIPPVIQIGALRANAGFLKLLALALFTVGQLCLLIVFVRAGGVGTIISGDESRNLFLKGLGLFFWPALFSFSGGVLYFAAQAKPNRRFTWVHGWPLWITAASWIIFQSRMKVLNLLVMGLLVSHYLVRPIRVARVGLYGALGFSFAVAVGYVRNPDVRYLLVANPSAVLSGLGDHFWEFSQAVLIGSFSRLRQIMLILDKVPSWMPHDWGASFFMVFNPVLRLVGMGENQVPGIGPRLFKLAHPELPGELETGYLSSLPGEFLVNFPFYFAIFLFPFYGIALRVVYSRLILRNADPTSVALYAILLLALVNMIFASAGQNLFELLVLWLPPLVAIRLAQLGAPSARAPLPLLEGSPGASGIGGRPGGR
jgi:hypothetical protein